MILDRRNDKNMSNLSLPLIIQQDDVKIREVVGCGAFSSVFRVSFRDEFGTFSNSLQTLVREQSSLQSSDIHSSNSAPDFCSQKFKCVLKRLNTEQFSCSEALDIALEGVRFEAKLLTELVPPHDHIVRVYGISHGLYEYEKNCFIIMECMESTLEKSINQWRFEKRHKTFNRWKEVSSLFHTSLINKRADLDSDYVRAICIGLPIAKALQHLHRYHILYRDLKPSNVGIDSSGRVRIFDFDLSRVCEVRPRSNESNLKSGRLHTQCVGSIRYMSPECATSTDYEFSSDVHSFAIVLWETMTLQRAFAKARDPLHFYELVFRRNMRPSLRTVSCPNLKSLLRVCWNPNPNLRPTFSSVVVELNSMQTNLK